MERPAKYEAGALTSRCFLTLNHFSLVTHPEGTQSLHCHRGNKMQGLPGVLKWHINNLLHKTDQSYFQPLFEGPLPSSYSSASWKQLLLLLFCICASPGLDIVAGVCMLSPGNCLLPSLPSFYWAVLQGLFFSRQRCFCEVPAYSTFQVLFLLNTLFIVKYKFAVFQTTSF